jgi:hypothetical protein
MRQGHVRKLMRTCTRSSETSVNFYQTTERHHSKDVIVSAISTAIPASVVYLLILYCSILLDCVLTPRPLCSPSSVY